MCISSTNTTSLHMLGNAAKQGSEHDARALLCIYLPGAFLGGDHVACHAVHGTGVAKTSESTLPSA